MMFHEPQGRHLAVVPISAEIVESLCFPGLPNTWFRCTKGLPPDAKCVGHHYDWPTNCYKLVFEHPSFPLVVAGQHIANAKQLPEMMVLNTKEIANMLLRE